MPLSTSWVGTTVGPVAHRADRRWTMAFAAGIGDASPAYLDTRSSALVAHPLFAVALEWPVVLELRRAGDGGPLTGDELLRGVHASHDLTVHRLVAPDEALSTTATVVAVDERPSGAHELLRLDTVDGDGAPVATTLMGNAFLGVEVDRTGASGDEAAVPEPPPTVDLVPAGEVEHHVPSTAAHVYTACSGIHNPIHTDVAVAEAAGLPGPILHGTATLATAVSDVVAATGDDPTLVRRVTCRFAAMVEIPSHVRVVVGDARPIPDDPLRTVVPFEVRNAHGEPAIRAGTVTLGLA